MRSVGILLGLSLGLSLASLPVARPSLAQEDGGFVTIDASSQEVLARAPVTEHARVKHVLIGWAELAPAYRGQMDPRAAARTQPEADVIVTGVLQSLRAGEPIEPLMAELSEDPGSALSGDSYEVTPDAGLVPPFKALGLRLNVGEVGLVLTDYGWHVIQRVE